MSGKLQEFLGVGQGANGCLTLAETAVKPGFQLSHGNVRSVLIVENAEGQAELGSELFQAQFGTTSLSEDIIGSLPNRRQVVHQRARPVKDDVSNHVAILANGASRATHTLSVAQSTAILAFYDFGIYEDERGGE